MTVTNDYNPQTLTVVIGQTTYYPTLNLTQNDNGTPNISFLNVDTISVSGIRTNLVQGTDYLAEFSSNIIKVTILSSLTDITALKFYRKVPTTQNINFQLPTDDLTFQGNVTNAVDKLTSEVQDLNGQVGFLVEANNDAGNTLVNTITSVVQDIAFLQINNLNEGDPTAIKTNLGLNNVNNTSDMDKPVSTAVQTLLSGKVDNTAIGQANGVASLDNTGHVPISQIPTSIIGGLSYQGPWNATTNLPLLQSGVGVNGNYYVVEVAGNTNLDGINIWNINDIAIFSSVTNKWSKTTSNPGVNSWNGRTGNVVATSADVGLNNYTLKTATLTQTSSSDFLGNIMQRDDLSTVASVGYNGNSDDIEILKHDTGGDSSTSQTGAISSNVPIKSFEHDAQAGTVIGYNDVAAFNIKNTSGTVNGSFSSPSGSDDVVLSSNGPGGRPYLNSVTAGNQIATTGDIPDSSTNPIFSVANSTTINLPPISNPIPFPTVNVNNAGGWDPVINSFIVPEKGLYFFSFCGKTSVSVGTSGGYRAIGLTIFKNGLIFAANAAFVAEMFDPSVSATRTNTTTLSSTLLVECDEGDLITLNVVGFSGIINPTGIMGVNLFNIIFSGYLLIKQS